MNNKLALYYRVYKRKHIFFIRYNKLSKNMFRLRDELDDSDRLTEIPIHLGSTTSIPYIDESSATCSVISSNNWVTIEKNISPIIDKVIGCNRKGAPSISALLIKRISFNAVLFYISLFKKLPLSITNNRK